MAGGAEVRKKSFSFHSDVMFGMLCGVIFSYVMTEGLWKENQEEDVLGLLCVAPLLSSP